MNELYWIGRAGALHDFCIGMIVISAIGFLIVGIVSADNYSYDIEPTSGFRKFVAGVVVTFFLGVIGAIFIPSKNELYAIYGLGTVIDYVQDNQTAQGIPDKAIKAIDKYLDGVSEKGDSQVVSKTETSASGKPTYCGEKGGSHD